MRVWITTVGESAFAVVNTIWAACVFDGFVPECVHLFQNLRVRDNVGKVKDWVKIILGSFGVNVVFVDHDVDEDDIDGFASEFRSVVDSERERGSVVAIDMTPGRKFMSAYAMVVGFECGVDKLYYLHLYDSSYQDRDFVLIPFVKQRLVNLLECGRGGV